MLGAEDGERRDVAGRGAAVGSVQGSGGGRGGTKKIHGGCQRSPLWARRRDVAPGRAAGGSVQGRGGFRRASPGRGRWFLLEVGCVLYLLESSRGLTRGQIRSPLGEGHVKRGLILRERRGSMCLGQIAHLLWIFLRLPVGELLMGWLMRGLAPGREALPIGVPPRRGMTHCETVDDPERLHLCCLCGDDQE